MKKLVFLMAAVVIAATSAFGQQKLFNATERTKVVNDTVKTEKRMAKPARVRQLCDTARLCDRQLRCDTAAVCGKKRDANCTRQTCSKENCAKGVRCGKDSVQCNRAPKKECCRQGNGAKK